MSSGGHIAKILAFFARVLLAVGICVASGASLAATAPSHPLFVGHLGPQLALVGHAFDDTDLRAIEPSATDSDEEAEHEDVTDARRSDATGDAPPSIPALTPYLPCVDAPIGPDGSGGLARAAERIVPASPGHRPGRARGPPRLS